MMFCSARKYAIARYHDFPLAKYQISGWMLSGLKKVVDGRGGGGLEGKNKSKQIFYGLNRKKILLFKEKRIKKAKRYLLIKYMTLDK